MTYEHGRHIPALHPALCYTAARKNSWPPWCDGVCDVTPAAGMPIRNATFMSEKHRQQRRNAADRRQAQRNQVGDQRAATPRFKPSPKSILLVSLVLTLGIAAVTGDWLVLGARSASAPTVSQTMQIDNLRVTLDLDQAALGTRTVNIAVNDASGTPVNIPMAS